jgi:hypothetical protein
MLPTALETEATVFEIPCVLVGIVHQQLTPRVVLVVEGLSFLGRGGW